MKKRYLLAACAALIAAPALADNCDKIVNHDMCLNFLYSLGGSNRYTAHFGPAGVFSLTGTSSTGTYSCKGGNFLEVNYLFGGFETQQWFARAASQGTKLSTSFGKSITNGYLYKITTASVGACPVLAAEGAPIIRSSQAD